MHKLFYNSRIVSDDMRDIFTRDVDWEEFYGSSFLITGATGMIASYFTLFLIWLNEEKKAEISITVMIRNKDKCKYVFREYSERNYFNIVMTDICNPSKPTGKYDYIVHAASLASGNYYLLNPVEVILPNCVGTNVLLQIAMDNAAKGFLLFSSGAVYGKMFNTSMKAIAEDMFGKIDPLAIHSCYDESKRISETLCMAYSVEYHVNAKIVRMAHTYAPTMDIYNDPRAFAAFIKCAVEKRDIELRSDGKSRREFCYITDAVAAYFIILQKGKIAEAYNISNMEQFLTIHDIAIIASQLEPENDLKVIHKYTLVNNPIVESQTVADIPQDNKKALELGCEFKVGIKEGLGRCLRYFREKDGY